MRRYDTSSLTSCHCRRCCRCFILDPCYVFDVRAIPQKQPSCQWRCSKASEIWLQDADGGSVPGGASEDPNEEPGANLHRRMIAQVYPRVRYESAAKPSHASPRHARSTTIVARKGRPMTKQKPECRVGRSKAAKLRMIGRHSPRRYATVMPREGVRRARLLDRMLQPVVHDLIEQLAASKGSYVDITTRTENGCVRDHDEDW
jgi:hypothetical protein